jgi:hypothetical protein
MEAKEKALELYNKYEQLGRDFTRGVSIKEFTKQCALIAVDEMINFLKYQWDSIGAYNYYMDTVEYEEVKKEIEAL